MRKSLKIPMSNSTISWRTQDMSKEVQSQLTLKKPIFFAIQSDESTDITGKA